MDHTCYSSIEQLQAAPDYAKYDRVWQRVAPQMNPYPEVRAGAMTKELENVPAMPMSMAAEQAEKRELSLPGAEENPCCMGTEAAEMTTVLEGFAQEEWMNGSTYCQLARFSNQRAAAVSLRALGRAAEQRARELNTIHYLITGEEKMPNSAAVLLPRLPYRVLLRDSYHAAVCNGFNYARAADETVDPCLKKILQRFSEANYAAAEEILHILTQVR